MGLGGKETGQGESFLSCRNLAEKNSQRIPPVQYIITRVFARS